MTRECSRIPLRSFEPDRIIAIESGKHLRWNQAQREKVSLHLLFIILDLLVSVSTTINVKAQTFKNKGQSQSWDPMMCCREQVNISDFWLLMCLDLYASEARNTSHGE